MGFKTCVALHRVSPRFIFTLFYLTRSSKTHAYLRGCASVRYRTMMGCTVQVSDYVRPRTAYSTLLVVEHAVMMMISRPKTPLPYSRRYEVLYEYRCDTCNTCTQSVRYSYCNLITSTSIVLYLY